MYLTSLTDKVYIKMIVNIKEKRMSEIDSELLEKMKMSRTMRSRASITSLGSAVSTLRNCQRSLEEN